MNAAEAHAECTWLAASARRPIIGARAATARRDDRPTTHPRLHHITHVSNLPSIVASGGLISDRAMRSSGGPAADIGMDTIKRRRLRLPVTCHPGDHVGDYVPSTSAHARSCCT